MDYLNKLIFIRAISKKNRHQFTIEWSDGRIADYRLSDVQRLCPCAGCCEKKIDRSIEEVEAVEISSVGGYALQIIFTQGCSKGIYPFSLLRQM